MEKSKRITINDKVYRIAHGNTFSERNCNVCDIKRICGHHNNKNNINFCFQTNLAYNIGMARCYFKREKSKDGTKTIYNINYE